MTKPKPPKLKPCKLCGKEPSDTYTTGWSVIMCLNHKWEDTFVIQERDEEIAIKKWNTRNEG